MIKLLHEVKYLNHAILPKSLRPYICNDLVRIGRNFDGGYLVSKGDVLKAEMLFGFGINDDWSFEKHFHSINSCPILAYDGSISARRFIKKNLVSILRPKKFLRSLKRTFDYFHFFTNSVKHIERHVGTGIGIGGNSCNIRNIIASAEQKMCFFKIDIEGSEYRILEDIIKFNHQICGLVIEFHDCDLHQDKISNFVERIGLKIVHIHANNYATIDNHGFPHVLELTFSRFGKISAKFSNLPHLLDMPNNPNIEDISIRFSD